MMCRADSQTNAATILDLAPTLMAHAKKDAPFVFPAQVTEKTCSRHYAPRMEANGSSTTSPSAADGC